MAAKKKTVKPVASPLRKSLKKLTKPLQKILEKKNKKIAEAIKPKKKTPKVAAILRPFDDAPKPVEIPFAPPYIDDFESTPANAASLAEVTTLARLMVRKGLEIAEHEKRGLELRARFKEISEEDIPMLMQELKLKEFTLDNGYKLAIIDEVYCAITEANKQPAFDWLAKTNNDGIIKTEVAVQFTRGEAEVALDFYNLLLNLQMSPDMNRAVHASTLKSFVKEQLANAADIPADVFSIRQVSTAKIKPPKASKVKGAKATGI